MSHPMPPEQDPYAALPDAQPSGGTDPYAALGMPQRATSDATNVLSPRLAAQVRALAQAQTRRDAPGFLTSGLAGATGGLTDLLPFLGSASKDLQARNPRAAQAGRIIGTIGTAVGPGPAAVKLIPRGATAVGRIASTAAKSGVLGGLFAGGMAPPGEHLTAAAKGGAATAVLGGGLQTAGEVTPYLLRLLGVSTKGLRGRLTVKEIKSAIARTGQTVEEVQQRAEDLLRATGRAPTLLEALGETSGQVAVNRLPPVGDQAAALASKAGATMKGPLADALERVVTRTPGPLSPPASKYGLLSKVLTTGLRHAQAKEGANTLQALLARMEGPAQALPGPAASIAPLVAPVAPTLPPELEAAAAALRKMGIPEENIAKTLARTQAAQTPGPLAQALAPRQPPVPFTEPTAANAPGTPLAQALARIANEAPASPPTSRAPPLPPGVTYSDLLSQPVGAEGAAVEAAAARARDAAAGRPLGPAGSTSGLGWKATARPPVPPTPETDLERMLRETLEKLQTEGQAGTLTSIPKGEAALGMLGGTAGVSGGLLTLAELLQRKGNR